MESTPSKSMSQVSFSSFQVIKGEKGKLSTQKRRAVILKKNYRSIFEEIVGDESSEILTQYKSISRGLSIIVHLF